LSCQWSLTEVTEGNTFANIVNCFLAWLWLCNLDKSVKIQNV